MEIRELTLIQKVNLVILILGFVLLNDLNKEGSYLAPLVT